MESNKKIIEYLKKKKSIEIFYSLVDKFKETNRLIINCLNLFYNVKIFLEFIFKINNNLKSKKKNI
jgi:hypothetical protein